MSDPKGGGFSLMLSVNLLTNLANNRLEYPSAYPVPIANTTPSSVLHKSAPTSQYYNTLKRTKLTLVFEFAFARNVTDNSGFRVSVTLHFQQSI